MAYLEAHFPISKLKYSHVNSLLPAINFTYRSSTGSLGNEYTERQLMENMPFTVSLPKIQYLRTSLIKEVMDVSSKSYITLKNVIKDDFQ